MFNVLMIIGIGVMIIIILAVPVWISNKKARQMDE